MEKLPLDLGRHGAQRADVSMLLPGCHMTFEIKRKVETQGKSNQEAQRPEVGHGEHLL